jgi:hypothetical protein
MFMEKEVLVGSFELYDAYYDMPIINPLLLIWRGIAKKLDDAHVSDVCFIEQLMDVVDMAVASSAGVPNSISGVQRTMAYIDQANGLIDAPIMWRKFVDDVAAQFEPGCQFIVRVGMVPPERATEFNRTIKRLEHKRVLYQTRKG